MLSHSRSLPERYAATASRSRSSGRRASTRSAADSWAKADAHARRSNAARPCKRGVPTDAITVSPAGFGPVTIRALVLLFVRRADIATRIVEPVSGEPEGSHYFRGTTP